MASTFDPNDKNSWYFGPMSRQDATELLLAEREGGVFLVRDSTTIIGDYVLCVKEDTKVSHYIVNKVDQGGQIKYRIGDQIFPDMASLLNFYTLHYLDTTPLIRPAPKRTEKVIARYDFDGKDPDDLPFRRGEILTVISKDEDEWWTGMNSQGETGSIPVPYVRKLEGDVDLQDLSNRLSSISTSSITSPGTPPPSQEKQQQPQQEKSRRTIQRKLPAYARVKQARVPNAYDKTALRLEVGDIIKVTKMHISGQWEGELHGKVGHFPFTHVEFTDPETDDDGLN